MRITGKAWLSLGLLAMVAWVAITALDWPLRTALFPLAIGIPVLVLLVLEIYFELFSKERGSEQEKGMDFRLSRGQEPSVTSRRTLSIFFWIIGFFFLILLVGFPIAVPAFFIFFLKFYGKERWKVSAGIAALAWISFYSLFVWILHTPFQTGWLQGWLGIP